MKLVLRGFSQDVDLGLDSAENYLLLQEEETGRTLRLPVPETTIAAIAQFMAVDTLPEAMEPEDQVGFRPAEEEEDEEEKVPPKLAAPKKLPRPGPASEDEVLPL